MITIKCTAVIVTQWQEVWAALWLYTY